MWYYALNNRPQGPVSEDQLRELIETGTVGANTLLWTEGMSDWQPAHAVTPWAERFAGTPASPPPVSTPSGHRTLAVLAHILGLFTGFIGPLTLLLATRDDFARRHARRCLNWQLSFLIYILVSIPLMLLLVGFLTLFVAGLLNAIFSIIGAVRAADGEDWKYPLAIPFTGA